MYLNFYQLQMEPFDITPDPEFLLLNESYKEALGAITYGIKNRKGFISVVGEVGTGKTTLLHAYLNRRDREKLIAIYIFDPSLSFDELVEECAIALGVDVSNATPGRKIQRLHWALLNAFKAGKNVALIIDEAQNLPIATLEKLRMLSNFETDKNKLMQLVLVGQPELRTKLNLHELRQLKQRVALTAEIRPLTYAESLEYIDHRIRLASYKRQSVFTRAAKRLIAKKAQGIPRNINVLADNALIAGYAINERPVKRGTVRSVLHDRRKAQDEPFGLFPRVRRALLAGAFLLAAGALGGLYESSLDRQPAGAAETHRPTLVLPEPLAADTAERGPEETAEPESSENAELPLETPDAVAGSMPADPDNSPTQPPAPAPAIPPHHAHDDPARESTIRLDVLEPTRAEAEPSTLEAEQELDRRVFTVGRGLSESDSAGVVPEIPEDTSRLLPDAERMHLAAARENIVLHPAIPPFKLNREEETNRARTETSVSEPEPRATRPVQRESEASTITAGPSEGYSRVWRVRRGEFMWGIALRNYGYVDDDLVELIRRANPDIPNINLIHPGDRVVLPPVERARGTVSSP